MFYLLTFSSLTSTQRGAKILNGAGLGATVTKSPSTAVTEGCTHGVRVGYSSLKTAVDVLRKNGHQPRHIYAVDPGGNTREVRL